MSPRRWLGILTVWLLPLALSAAAPDVAQAWRDASTLSSRAHEGFAVLLSQQRDTLAELALGDALTLLTKQPATLAQREEARRKLRALAVGEDDPAQAAKYFLARLAQGDEPAPHFEEAAALYRELLARHAEGYWGQLALGKLAVLQLYVLPIASPAARLDSVETLLPRAAPTLRRDLHLMLADAGLFYRQDERAALQHLLAAEALDHGEQHLGASRRADLLVQIADISARLDELAQAKRYAQLLAGEFPQDWRMYPLQQLIQAMAEGRPQVVWQ